MTTECSTRFDEVADALQACADEKLLMVRGSSPTETARKAYDLATQSPQLPAPWPELAAYRLAHVLMRTATRPAQLEEVDRLLVRAAGAVVRSGPRTLGPLPALYRLAVLHRLSPGQAGSLVAQEALRQARDAVREWGEREREPTGPRNMPTRIQSDYFNMLELATYFLGGDYSEIQGLGEREDWFPTFNGWYVLGMGASGGTIMLSREFALEQLESLGQANPSAAVLVIVSNKDGFKWRVAQSRDWTNANDDCTKLLSWILKEPHMDREELRQRVFERPSDPDTQSYFRQIVRRTPDWLRELTGQPNLKVFTSTDPLRLAPTLQLYVAVHKGTLKPSPRGNG